MMNIRTLPDRAKAFGALRILFGLIWLLNTFLQANSAYVGQFLHSFHADWVAGQPAWLAFWHVDDGLPDDSPGSYEPRDFPHP